MAILADLVPSLLGVAVLAAVATAVLAVFRVPHRWAPAAAIARGAVQLAVISVILTGIIGSPVLIAAALLVMFTVASAVATARVGWSGRHVAAMSTSIAAGVLVAAVTVFASGALALTSRYALAIGAIIIGNAMSIATLTGRNLTTSVHDHWDHVEGWLALGAPPRRSTLDLARRAVRDALVPSVDQTKTTGLVVLPGAFVGAIFGGISPLEAGRFQIVVLASILAAGSVTAVMVALWFGAVTTKPGPPS
ncbi:ABC transporter permease [Microbacterium thalassium]|uniref:Putative ABC transport system permease protein n=1 Tax=Microbacterium thalassium TaxID=362649 RepID=A0A7X0FLZ7_9MICO|nr:ABC transporter permease [Microbacterium thalassium]MBB6389948.1 putative ABC transport system permease protein [Microbacterium thalassium]GLK24634.1 ABC transporter permease [Microbacterium thalassium]